MCVYVCMYVCVDMRQSHCLTHFFFVFFPLGWLVAIQARARARSISIPFLWWRVRQSIASITWITCARFVLCVCTVLRDLDWLLPLCVCVCFFFSFSFSFASFSPPPSHFVSASCCCCYRPMSAARLPSTLSRRRFQLVRPRRCIFRRPLAVW